MWGYAHTQLATMWLSCSTSGGPYPNMWSPCSVWCQDPRLTWRPTSHWKSLWFPQLYTLRGGVKLKWDVSNHLVSWYVTMCTHVSWYVTMCTHVSWLPYPECRGTANCIQYIPVFNFTLSPHALFTCCWSKLGFCCKYRNFLFPKFPCTVCWGRQKTKCIW